MKKSKRLPVSPPPFSRFCWQSRSCQRKDYHCVCRLKPDSSSKTGRLFGRRKALAVNGVARAACHEDDLASTHAQGRWYVPLGLPYHYNEIPDVLPGPPRGRNHPRALGYLATLTRDAPRALCARAVDFPPTCARFRGLLSVCEEPLYPPPWFSLSSLRPGKRDLQLPRGAIISPGSRDATWVGKLKGPQVRG